MNNIEFIIQNKGVIFNRVFVSLNNIKSMEINTFNNNLTYVL